MKNFFLILSLCIGTVAFAGEQVENSDIAARVFSSANLSQDIKVEIAKDGSWKMSGSIIKSAYNRKIISGDSFDISSYSERSVIFFNQNRRTVLEGNIRKVTNLEERAYLRGKTTRKADYNMFLEIPDDWQMLISE